MNQDRYTRQRALPEITAADQTRLSNTHITMIGAGGLGTTALPALAAAGIDHITIIDHDEIERSNLHRQTIYKDSEVNQSKAETTAAYLRALNPEIKITAIPKRLTPNLQLPTSNLLLDGSDNFETKTLLNQISINTNTPLISASVNQWQGQIGIFAGYATNAPCYHCLFPDLPTDAQNCNAAGILGTSAGLCGLWQAHLTLCLLLGIENTTPGTLLTLDFKTMRMQNLTIEKNQNCAHCKDAKIKWTKSEKETNMPDMINFKDLTKDHIIIDVRTLEEIEADPIAYKNLIHMEVSTIPANHEKLPKNTPLAFVCAGNIRSVQAVEYLSGIGYDNLTVLDKFSI